MSKILSKYSLLLRIFDIRASLSFLLLFVLAGYEFSYYKESHKILGNTYGMCVLQDFEAITPNLLARTIETVEGGGLIILLLKTMTSLKQLYTMTMVCPRFLSFFQHVSTNTCGYRTSTHATEHHYTILSLPGSTSVSFSPSVHVQTVWCSTTN